MMLPCCNNLHQEDVESQNKINFKFREKQPKFEVHFKILIHYFACYLRACFCFFFLNVLGDEIHCLTPSKHSIDLCELRFWCISAVYWLI